LDKSHFDIIFLDYTMPGKHRLEILKEIKILNYNTIIVIITGKAEDDIKDDLIAEGAFSLINKPFTIDQIQNTVAQILGANNI